MSYQVAEETQSGKVVYPSCLPKDRGQESSCWILGEIFVALSIAGVFNATEEGIIRSIRTLAISFSFMVLLIISGQLVLIRFGLFMGEWNHLEGRYEGSFFKLVQNAWSTNTATKLTVLWSLSVVTLSWLSYGDLFILSYRLGCYSIIAVVVAAYLLCQLIRVEESDLQNSINLEQMNGLDYGSGLAYSFFYGYLNICLPDRGGEEKGIKERIEDYISTERLSELKFPVKKLFILIPASTFTPNILDNVADGWMVPAGSLGEQVKNRAGVTSRVYKNSVYRIQKPDSEDPPIYVVAEGATPLKTLHDVVNHSGEKQEFYRKHRKEIISMFYKTLLQIIKRDRDCRDVCELIYYVDVDEHGDNCVNVARLILERIGKLQDRERRRRQL